MGLFGGIYNARYMQPTYLHALIFGPALRKAIQQTIKLAATFVIFGLNDPEKKLPCYQLRVHHSMRKVAR